MGHLHIEKPIVIYFPCDCQAIGPDICFVVLIPAATESAECVVVVTPSLTLMMRKRKKTKT